MALDEKSNNPAYVLGRVFSVLEDIQEQAAGCVHRELIVRLKIVILILVSVTPNIIFPYYTNCQHIT